MVLLTDLEKVAVKEVLIAGKFVSELSLEKTVQDKLTKSHPPLQNTMKRHPLLEKDLQFKLVLGLTMSLKLFLMKSSQNITKFFTTEPSSPTMTFFFMANIERYGHNREPGLGLVKGMGLKSGALASSVAHDSHNLMVIGTNARDMAVAVNTLIENGGGFVVVDHGKVQSLVKLPIAGLLSLQSAEEIKTGIEELKKSFSLPGSCFG